MHLKDSRDVKSATWGRPDETNEHIDDFDGVKAFTRRYFDVIKTD